MLSDCVSFNVSLTRLEVSVVTVKFLLAVLVCLLHVVNNVGSNRCGK